MGQLKRPDAKSARWGLDYFASSDGAECRTSGCSKYSRRDWCFRSTASRLRKLRGSFENKMVEKILEGSTGLGPRGGLHFVRTVAPDDEVLCELICELERRRIPVVVQQPWANAEA